MQRNKVRREKRPGRIYGRLFPIPTVNLSNGAERRQYDAIVKLVTRILAATAADQAADTLALEREIDEIVYELYGLTAEEIAIVEGERVVKQCCKAQH